MPTSDTITPHASTLRLYTYRDPSTPDKRVTLRSASVRGPAKIARLTYRIARKEGANRPTARQITLGYMLQCGFIKTR